MKNEFDNEINNLIVKYNIDKNDPLFAFIEIQLKILKEIQETKNEILNNKPNDNLIDKIRDEFYFLSKEKLSQAEKELSVFLSNIKTLSKKEIEDYVIDIKNDHNQNLIKMTKNNDSISKKIVSSVVISILPTIVIGLSLYILNFK